MQNLRNMDQPNKIGAMNWMDSIMCLITYFLFDCMQKSNRIHIIYFDGW